MSILFSLIGAMFMATYFVSVRALLKDKGDPKAFTFITTLFGGVLLFSLLPFETISFVFNLQTVAVLIILAVLFAFTDLTFILGRKLEEVSRASLFVQAGQIWALLGGVFILGEELSLAKIIGVCLIVTGNLIVIWNGQTITFTKGTGFLILGTLIFTIASFVDKQMVPYFSPLFYKGMLFIAEAFILFLLFVPGRIHIIKKEFRIQGMSILCIGPLIALGAFFLQKAYEAGGEASVVLPVFGLSLVFSSIGGIIFLKERKDTIRKLIALVVGVIGTVILQMV